ARLGNWKQELDAVRGKSLSFYRLPMCGPEDGWRPSLLAGNDPSGAALLPAHQQGMVPLSNLDEAPPADWEPYGVSRVDLQMVCAVPSISVNPELLWPPELSRLYRDLAFRLYEVGTTYDVVSVAGPLDGQDGIGWLTPPSSSARGITFVRYSTL